MAAMIWPWVLSVAVASTPAFSVAAAEERQDPALVRLAEQSGCSGTPRGYVPGYFSAGDPSSGVFWCRRGEGYAEQGRVVFVVVDRGPVKRLQCPNVIAAINEPGELRVLHGRPLPLSVFVVRHEPWRRGPAGQVTDGPIVDAVDGAVGEQWVCHQGMWLVRVHH